jgi:hypothetical protein
VIDNSKGTSLLNYQIYYDRKKFCCTALLVVQLGQILQNLFLNFNFFVRADILNMVHSLGPEKGKLRGNITVPLTSCLAGLESAV